MSLSIVTACGRRPSCCRRAVTRWDNWLDTWRGHGLAGMQDTTKSGRTLKFVAIIRGQLREKWEYPSPNLKALVIYALKKAA